MNRRTLRLLSFAALLVCAMSLVTPAHAHGKYLNTFGTPWPLGGFISWPIITAYRMSHGGLGNTHTHEIRAQGWVVAVEVWRNP